MQVRNIVLSHRLVTAAIEAHSYLILILALPVFLDLMPDHGTASGACDRCRGLATAAAHLITEHAAYHAADYGACNSGIIRADYINRINNTIGVEYD